MLMSNSASDFTILVPSGLSNCIFQVTHSLFSHFYSSLFLMVTPLVSRACPTCSQQPAGVLSSDPSELSSVSCMISVSS